MLQPQKWLPAVAAAAVALALASCGSSSSSSSSSTSGQAATGSASTSGSATSQTIKVTPKTIGVVNLIGSAAPIEASTNSVIQGAAAALGWHVKIAAGGGNPQKWLSAAQTLINQHVDALITTSIEGSTLRPALLAAKQANIPVIAVEGGTAPSPLFTAKYEEDETKMGTVLANYIKKTVPAPKIINLQVTVATSGAQRNAAFRAVFPPSAFVFQQQIDQTDPNGNAQKAVTEALQKDPSANVIHSAFDTMEAAASAAALAQHSNAKVYSYFNFGPDRILLMNPHSAEAAVVTSDVGKTAAVAVNQLLGYFQKHTPIDPNALAKDPLTYSIVTKAQAPTTPAPTATQILAPFIAKWKSAYGG